MAASKVPPQPGATALAPKPARTGVPTGQNYAERKAADRVELSIWVSTATQDKLTKLVKILGVKFPKQVVEQAITELASKYGL